MKRLGVFLVLALFAIVGAQCEPQGAQIVQAGPRSWIDAPLPGGNLPLGQIEVTSHSSDLLRIVRVELSVNGAVVRSDLNPDSQRTLATMRQQWMPSGPGNYSLTVRAQNSAGVWGDYAQTLVTIGGVAGGTVQGAVYSDLNGNGIANDPGDAPLDGVLVTLSGCASKTATTVNGTFQFTGLPAGTCLVEVSKAGWKFSGTYPPGIGYPAKAASDPALPTSFSIFMTPLATPTPTPAPKPGVTVLPPAGIAFFADQLRLVAGQCTTIHWQVTNASQVFVDNAPVAASGAKQDCPTQTTTHTLRVVTLDNQTVQRSLTITVVPPTITPTRTATPVTPAPPRGCSGPPNIAAPFTASPSTISPGGSSTLSWGAVTNADSVEIDHGIGGVGTPGSTTVSPAQTTTYTLTARCGSNTKTQQATVTVQSRVLPPPVSDTTGPTISDISASPTTFYRTAGCGAVAVTVRAHVTDPSGVANVTLFYRVGSSGSFTSASMSYVYGDFTGYSRTVNASEVPGTAVGTFQFYIFARDNVAGFGNTSQSPTNTSVTLSPCIIIK